MINSNGLRVFEQIFSLFQSAIQTVITNAPIFAAVMVIMFAFAVTMYLFTAFLKGKK